MEPTSVSFTSDPWYVVYCKPKREFYAASILNSLLGLTIYLPEIEVHLRREIQRLPFFRSYFFIQANLQKIGLSCINSSPGVLKLLDFGDGPLTVPQALIKMLHEEISTLSIYGNSSPSKLASGDLVRVTNGPFEGLRAVFIESLTSGERAHVLLHFLGRLSKVQMDVNSLEKLNNEPSRRERQTRGKGRRINRVHELQ